MTSLRIDIGHRETRKPRWWRRTRLLLYVAFATPSFGAFAQDEEGLVFDVGDGVWLPAAMLETDVHFRIRGLVAEVEVRQRFVNGSPSWLEGRYLMPLPENAAVHAMRVEAGDRLIEGEVREKEEARIEYQAAAAQGHRAGLVEQNRPNLFQTRVANVGPGEEVTVSVGYWQRVDFDGERFSIHLPLTLVPRYRHEGGGIDGDAHALPASVVAQSQHTSLEPTVSITVELSPGVQVHDIASPTHDLDVAPSGDGFVIRLADTVVASDRDFALEWTPVASESPTASLFVEDVAGTRYALAMLMPPTVAVDPLPRELVIVIDHSGSMHGTSMQQAREAAAIAIERLGRDDYFNVIRFDDSTEALFEASVPAGDPILRQQALEWVRDLEAEGGTELSPALAMAFAGAPAGDRLRQVVLITDAGVGNENALLAQIGEQMGEARLFPVGIGSAPNGYFLREAARIGRGSEVTIRDIGTVGREMDRLFARLDRPALRDLAIEWPQGADAFPRVAPDLYHGEPLLAVAKLDPTVQAGAIRVAGSRKSQPWRAQLPLAGKRGDDEGIGRLWAREKLTALDDALRLGADEEEVRQEGLSVALEHHLVSRYTSLVAVDRTPVRPKDEDMASTRFANAAPADGLAFAAGGTDSRSRIALAAALALFALAIGHARRIRWLTETP